MKSKLATTLAFCAGLIGLAGATPASATLITVSAADFVRQCNPGCSGALATLVNGALTVDNFLVLFHDVELPQAQRVCSFTLVYGDTNNAEFITARLLRKVWAAGSNVNAPPLEMARATSPVGLVSGARAAVDNTILSNPINNVNSLYYVELTIPNINLVALGVMLDVRPTCP